MTIEEYKNERNQSDANYSQTDTSMNLNKGYGNQIEYKDSSEITK